MRAPTAVLLVGVMAVGGCGGSGSSDGSAVDVGPVNSGVSAVGGQAMVDAQLAFARCMRKQGIDFPDPGSRGMGFDPRSQGISEERLKEAEEGCRPEAKAIADAAPPRDAERLEDDRDATLRLARCMRDQGQDVPDPVSGEGGTSISVPPDAKTNPQFEQAFEKCEQFLRDGGPQDR